MREIPEYEKDLASIRSIMERSAKFISLSGLSGIMSGIYALCGAAAAFYLIQYPLTPSEFSTYSSYLPGVRPQLLLIAIAVLAASITTGLWLSGKKARRHGLKLWTPTSRNLLINISIPLLAGGTLILILLFTGHFGLSAPVSLIFYGLALIQGSQNTFDEIRYLGLLEIAIGLVAAIFPGYGLLFWAVGFGILHIIYGAIMYNKYDK